MLFDQIKALLQNELPSAQVDMSDPTASGNHFEATIVSPAFEGRSRIDRHRMVLDLLKQHFDQSLHAFTFKTLTPEEFKK
jgi:stress-induced morphogen